METPSEIVLMTPAVRAEIESAALQTAVEELEHERYEQHSEGARMGLDLAIEVIESLIKDRTPQGAA